jgi:hypothetical protein
MFTHASHISPEVFHGRVEKLIGAKVNGKQCEELFQKVSH